MHVGVVGAGVHGLSTAWQLGNLGVGRVTLLERFDAGHDRGSSHGHSRITRSTYPEEVFVRLAGEAHEDAWPRLERDSGRRLIHPRPGFFFGDPKGIFGPFAETMSRFGDRAEMLDPPEAARRVPWFRLEAHERAILDRTAGLVAAAETMLALREQCAARGVTFVPGTAVERLEPGGSGVTAHADGGGSWTADAWVVCAGPWTARLFPALQPRLTAKRQHVAYVGLADPGHETELPVWAYLGPTDRDFIYGLPRHGRAGVKLARHETEGAGDDPDRHPGPDPAKLEDMVAFLRDRLTVPVRGLLDGDTCFYTNTPDEFFVLDRDPAEPRVVVGAGFSGHGFKFAPHTGRILAELVLGREPDSAAFREHRARFRFAHGSNSNP